MLRNLSCSTLISLFSPVRYPLRNDQRGGVSRLSVFHPVDFPADATSIAAAAGAG